MINLSSFKIQYDFAQAARIFFQGVSVNKESRMEMRKAFEWACRAQWHQAGEQFAKLVSMEPIAFNARFHAGICFLLSGQVVQAIEFLRSAEENKPDDFGLHLYAGIANHLLGLFGKANAHWWAAHRIEENDTILSLMRTFFTHAHHPERLALYPLCRGLGIDVGCGPNKTHPDAIGVDLTPFGELGSAGCTLGRPSKANIAASGDALSFKSNVLDYVVARHNLEHYVDPILALSEWCRVLKPGGILGIIVPDERFCDSIRLDKTHKHVFTPSSLRRILDLMACFDIVHLEKLLYRWSFICIAQKRPIASGRRLDYPAALAAFEGKQISEQILLYREKGDMAMAEQCEHYAKALKQSSTSIPGGSKTADPVPPLTLGLVQGDGYGWGVCSRYLIQEISKIRSVQVLDSSNGSAQNKALSGLLFQALTNVDFDPMFPLARAERNFGYTFFENELTRRSMENAKRFDKVLGGSTWCLDRMREKGIANGEVLIQGIDPEIFYPIDAPADPERFVIFSGGKFELRKGQDLVLRAVKIMQDKYPDVWLVNSWYNLWPASTRLMGYSPHIRFEHCENERWTATMTRTYAANGLDNSRIVTCELMPQNLQRDLYSRSDIGLFPNRCEGGTNLVLMEYMACAKPVIASNTSGHRDIVNEGNALLLNRLTPFNVADGKGEVIARWQDPSLDEIVAHLEHAYQHREKIRQIGLRAGRDLKNFTWGHSAQRLLQIIEEQV